MKNILTIILIAFIFYGCKSEIGPAGPSLKGNISGTIILIDSSGKRMNDKSGVIITVEEKSISTTSNVQGYWILNDLLTGTYTITVVKSGFDSYKYYGYQFVGGGTAQMQSVLHQLPTYEIQSISVGSSTFDKNIIISGNITSTNNQTLILFISKAASVSNSSYDYYSLCYANNGSYVNYIYNSSLYSYGILTGDKIYIIAYPSTNGGWNSYVDPNTGKDVITSIKMMPSKIDSVIVP